MLLQLIDVPHWFHIIMFLRVGFSLCPRGESEWCILYCDILLLKQLLLDICQAAGDFCCHACTRTLSCSCDTRLRTSHQMYVVYQQTIIQSCKLQITKCHSGMRLSETARDVKHRWWNELWLLTEWHTILYFLLREGRIIKCKASRSCRCIARRLTRPQHCTASRTIHACNRVPVH